MEYKYKFSYGNIFKYLGTQYIIICYHVAILVYSFGVICFVYEYFDDGFISIILKVLSVAQFFALFAYFSVVFFIPKKVILTNYFIKVRRYFLNVSYAFRGFNDEIFIKDITECKKYDGKRYRFDRRDPYSVFFFNWDDLVEIRTNDDKKYLIPVKNSDDFVEKVNEIRRSFQEDKAWDNTLC